MEKDLLKKKYGLPPIPSVVPSSGAQVKRNMIRKKDYSPVYWDKYFENKHDVQTYTGDVFRVYERGDEGPVLFFLHGGGFSALSWSLLSAQVTSLVKCRCVAVDLRGHGDSTTSDDSNLSAEQMSSDVANIITSLYKEEFPPIILVGHSMGGAIAVHTAVRNLIGNLVGLAVIDVVEGTALEALASMQSFLRGRPKSFETIEKAIEWAVRSGQIMNLESARVSMVGQLKSSNSDETGTLELEHQQVTFTDTIAEEQEDEGNNESTSSNVFKVPVNPQTKQNSYTWRIDLSQTEKFWQGWFEGLSQKFLSCEAPKILILAGPDRLDKDLTIGQMQGKFQMNLLPQCGHAVHEDVPERVADILANFMMRHKLTDAIGSFERSIPGC
ncbi:protein phosphatase methylesterase 1-like isoform X3 [Physella acuta]|uniref:protein phosphatase methylesterase 1-like isoform X3 n=1 Tax=Physella acuta TaxID=109671 RepID=UPI0027DD30F5|nr:protein phosphatase methylesterase 1-like isoform X3 [Physella acuta]XP_059147255.1 protein phosphatase methylesterase 1-like isoform X3 [Physella acuta]XP_059147256.1 protein phosphatase methylesterase 1-like isoform X3 [Physella acuta]